VVYITKSMAKPRNILFLQSSSEGYGSAKIILQVLSLYQQLGFSPYVVLTNSGPLEGALHELQIPYSIQNLGILRRKYLSPVGLVNRLIKSWRAYSFLSRLHQKQQFELVYSNTLAVVVGAVWAMRNNLPHHWHIHEIVKGPTPLVRGLASLLDRSTPFPIAVSHAVANHWQPLLKKAKIQVIHNGLPYTEFEQARQVLKKELGLPESSLLVGMVGRINPGKGQFFFLELAEKLAPRFPTAHFVLAGDPFSGYESLLEDLKQAILNKGIADRVHYLGFREDIPELMASLDLFILPSILPDSFPTVILEAMAAGKPVVATDSGGASEMIEEGHTGYVIPIGATEAATAALEKLLSNDTLRREMGRAGQVRVQEVFSLVAFQQKLTTHLWQQLKRI
jgi:glycosyltransferase involved in cell wall biosynthesis